MITAQAERLIIRLTNERSRIKDIEKIEKINESMTNLEFEKRKEIIRKNINNIIEIVLGRIDTLLDSYKEQLSVMHQIYMDLLKYNCGKHKKLGNKIQIQIEVLRESIKEMENSQTSGKVNK